MNENIKIRHDKDKFGKPLKAYFKVPSYVTFYKFLKKLDLVDFGVKLSAWLQSQEGTLPRRLALDGKQETARNVLDANGNYLLQIKGNQATIPHLSASTHGTTQGSSANGCAANGASRNTMRDGTGHTARTSAPVAATRT